MPGAGRWFGCCRFKFPGAPHFISNRKRKKIPQRSHHRQRQQMHYESKGNCGTSATTTTLFLLLFHRHATVAEQAPKQITNIFFVSFFISISTCFKCLIVSERWKNSLRLFISQLTGFSLYSRPVIDRIQMFDQFCQFLFSTGFWSLEESFQFNRLSNNQ